MKKSVVKTILLLFAVITYVNMFASGNYQQVMKAHIEKMYEAKTAEELTAVSSAFYRIAEKEKGEWLPWYYACYSRVRITFFIKDGVEINRQLDIAQQYMDSLIKSAHDNSEVHVLQALIYSMRITDPSLGMKYSALSSAALDRAQALDKNNPRVYYCRGSNVYHTPSFVGGGKEKAKPLFEKAKQLFTQWEAPLEFWPEWGEYYNQLMLDTCNK
jgi:hypothetical protein